MTKFIFICLFMWMVNLDRKSNAQQVCDRFIQNDRLLPQQYYTDASHDSANSDMALAVTGKIWRPMIKDTVFWSAGVRKNARCSLRSMKFRYRNIRHYAVRATPFNSEFYEVVKTGTVPYDVLATQWGLGKVRLPEYTEHIEIVLQPSLGESIFETPQLSSVSFKLCCKAECDHTLLNQEMPDLYTNSSVMDHESYKALYDNRLAFKPMHNDTVYWYAGIPDVDTVNCRLHNVRFKFRYSSQVDVQVKLPNKENFIHVMTVPKPLETAARDWVVPARIKFPLKVEKLLFKLYPSMEGPNDMPQLRDVKVYTCCLGTIPQ